MANNAFTISASSDSYSIIQPSGLVNVNNGNNETFYYSAKNGGVITQVIVDNVTVPITGSYTFTNVQASHTIFVFSSPPPPPTPTPTPIPTATPTLTPTTNPTTMPTPTQNPTPTITPITTSKPTLSTPWIPIFLISMTAFLVISGVVILAYSGLKMKKRLSQPINAL